MPEPRNVLVFPGGTEIGLEIRQALSLLKEVVLFSAASESSNHAPFAYRDHTVLPGIDEDGWFDALRAFVAEKRIDYVFPAHEDVLLELARRRDELGAVLIAPDTATCETVRSKRATYAALDGSVRVPALFDPADPALPFPVFVKPDRGAGSRGAQLVRDRDELDRALAGADEDMVVCEYLPGKEYTVDCFSDRETGLLFAGPRRRVRMRNGIAMDSFGEEEPRAAAIASAVSDRLGMRGAWFCQVREDADGELCLLEVGARIAGTMGLHRNAGVNFPLLSIYESERKPVSILVNDVPLHIDRALTNRYAHQLAYSTVYVDLDDTLLLRGQVNTQLVRLLYQCVNRGCRIVVLTRHAADPIATLERHRLGALPDEVVHLAEGESKADHISAEGAIFIDDSFGERLDVARRLGIPTFDCSMLEMLVDDRA